MTAPKQDISDKKTPSGNPDQKWVQDSSRRFDSYEKAHEAFELLDAPKKRIRLRRGNKYDLIGYRPLLVKSK